MIDALSLTQTLGGIWHGRYGTAPCPVCQPDARKDQNALTINDGHMGLVTNCKKAGCAFMKVLSAAGVIKSNMQRSPARHLQVGHRSEVPRTASIAQKIWDEAKSVEGSLVENYLREVRKITAPLADSLRFHPKAWNGERRANLPTMIARIDGASAFGIHRTFLDEHGQRHLGKMMLGGSGGGAVRLIASDAPCIAVAEGIETALSLASGLLELPASIWAALSASNMRCLKLPNRSGHLIIALDRDKAGITAAIALRDRAHSSGWTVDLMTPPNGMDWNDVLISQS